MTQSSQLIDVSHVVAHGEVTYKGLPAPIICDFLSREASRPFYTDGTEFHIGKIEMVANTGTYLDAPFHRFAEGKDLAELPLESLANLEAVVVRVENASQQAIEPDAFAGVEIAGKAVLIHTNWSQHWQTERYWSGQHPFLSKASALYLREKGAVLVGIDSYNMDDIHDGSRPVHTILLGADIPIVEHMTNLAALPDSDFKFFAVPVKVKAFGTFPVRAFGLYDR